MVREGICPEDGKSNFFFGGFTDVSSGDCHVAALRADGTIYTYGCNTKCQLGYGRSNFTERLPARFTDYSDYIGVIARHAMTCGVRKSLDIICYGGFGDVHVPSGTQCVTDEFMRVHLSGGQVAIARDFVAGLHYSELQVVGISKFIQRLPILQREAVVWSQYATHLMPLESLFLDTRAVQIGHGDSGVILSDETVVIYIGDGIVASTSWRVLPIEQGYIYTEVLP
jgi:hypothetical protein